MRRTICYLLFCLFIFSSYAGNETESIESVIQHGLNVSRTQALLMAADLKDSKMLPRSLDRHNKLITSNYRWWCSGFFPGVLWYLDENFKNDKKLRSNAENFTSRLTDAQYITDNHDLGFMLMCSFGNGYRLTGNDAYKQVLLKGAESLSRRFSPKIGLIRSWDFNKDRWEYPVIIDNMMNLELLTWASRHGGKQDYMMMARSHADKTMENHFRADHSCYHVVSYDTITCRPEKKETWQGYNNESAWSRGQGWALYGFTVMYRETGNILYLHQANAIADYIIHNPNMPADGIPYWDFDAPRTDRDSVGYLRDASAAAVICSALIELARYADSPSTKEYIDFAEKQLRTLSSSEYLSEPGENGHFILKHSVGFLGQDSEVDKPLTYADYYYVEALTRMKTYLANITYLANHKN